MTKENGFACYAMLIDNKTLEIIAKHFPNETFEDHDEMVWFLERRGIVETTSQFDGQAFPILDNGDVWYTDNAEQLTSSNPTAYISLRRQPGLFYAAYYNMESIIAELKSHVGYYLPADYDYRQHLRFIVGSYYG